jgi:hypothetical protein
MLETGKQLMKTKRAVQDVQTGGEHFGGFLLSEGYGSGIGVIFGSWLA